MTFTLSLVLAGAIITGLLALFWIIRIIMVALNKHPASNTGSILLIIFISIAAVSCVYLTTTALSLTGIIPT